MDDELMPPSGGEVDDHNRDPAKPREYESTELLHGDKEVLIHHMGETYRLRLTKNDKLILQK